MNRVPVLGDLSGRIKSAPDQERSALMYLGYPLKSTLLGTPESTTMYYHNSLGVLGQTTRKRGIGCVCGDRLPSSFVTFSALLLEVPIQPTTVPFGIAKQGW